MLGQIVKNDMFILILPFLIGAAVRASCRRAKRAYLVTIGLIALAAIAWAAAYAIPSHRSELYGLIVRLKRDG